MADRHVCFMTDRRVYFMTDRHLCQIYVSFIS